MNNLHSFLSDFSERSQQLLGDRLIGIYLHGSAAMGCFNTQKSGIDLLIVVNRSLSAEVKRQYMDMVVEMNERAPKKGIELSIVKEDVCKPFIYPTPFELHFSNTHLKWYKTDPNDYINKMNGVDKDLAAHFTIIYHRGKCLYGKAITDAFEKVAPKDYFDSIWFDVKNAKEDILTDPTYIVLNLCRVLAYRQEKLILSKQEGGTWGLSHIPEKYNDLILQALNDYSSNKDLKCNEISSCDHIAYASYMIEQIIK